MDPFEACSTSSLDSLQIMAMAGEVQRTFALARQKLGEVLSAVEFCDRSAIDFVFLGLKNLKNGTRD